MIGFRAVARSCAFLVALVALLPTGGVRADTNSQVINWLAVHDTYITNSPIRGQAIHSGDLQRLNKAVADASVRGVTEKLAILSHYPFPHFADMHAAADGLLATLQLSGVLVLVSPHFTIGKLSAPGGIGIASDQMSRRQELAIERRVAPRCIALGYVSCITYAADLAVAQVRRDKNSAFHDAAVFWFVAIVGLGLVILAAVLILSRRRTRDQHDLAGLRQAAYDTLGTADTAVQEIEANAQKLSSEARQEYDRALGLRDRARKEIDGSQTLGGLRQANEDAAQAVLAMQGTMRQAGIEGQLSSPLEVSQHRCFYCGRTDRPPYTPRTIDDSRGNTMQVEICSVDLQTLKRGQTPQFATVQNDGSPIPWWAVPTSPWYYNYGGPSWQYWLPFMIGMDVGGWYGGGWSGGYEVGSDEAVNAYYGEGSGSDLGDGQHGTETGAGDFTGWTEPDGGASGGDSVNWAGDTGGWGSGSGGGDTGGGDWRGVGDSGGSGGDSSGGGW